MRTRLRAWPPAGAAGKQKSGPRARSTMSQPWKTAPSVQTYRRGPARQRATTSADGHASSSRPATHPATARQRTPAHNGGPARHIFTSLPRHPSHGRLIGRVPGVDRAGAGCLEPGGVVLSGQADHALGGAQPVERALAHQLIDHPGARWADERGLAAAPRRGPHEMRAPSPAGSRPGRSACRAACAGGS